MTSPAIMVQNESRFIKLGDFKVKLKDNGVNFTQAEFTKMGPIFVLFENQQTAADGEKILKTLCNYKNQPYKLKLIPEFEIPSKRHQRNLQQKKDKSEENSVMEAVGEKTVQQTSAPFYDVGFAGDEAICKQKILRNALKNQMVKIFRGQTSAAANHNLAETCLKMRPFYVQDERICKNMTTYPPLIRGQVKKCYRTKNEFRAAKVGDQVKIGCMYRVQGAEMHQFSSDETYECGIFPEVVMQIARRVEQLLQRDEAIVEGEIGQLLIKCSGDVVDDQFIVTQTIAFFYIGKIQIQLETQKQLAELSSDESLKLVAFQIREKDVQIRKTEDLFIVQTLFGLKFKLTETSFFQSNVDGAQLLFKTLSDMIIKNLDVSKVANQKIAIYDICCGCGVIGQILAKLLVEQHYTVKILGIDMEADAVVAAQEQFDDNFAGINDITAHYFAGMIQDCRWIFSTERLKAEKQIDLSDFKKVFIMDPPRTGLHKTVLETIRNNSEIDELFYVSCNPKTLAQDLFYLCSVDVRKCNKKEKQEIKYEAKMNIHDNQVAINLLNEEQKCVNGVQAIANLENIQQLKMYVKLDNKTCDKPQLNQFQIPSHLDASLIESQYLKYGACPFYIDGLNCVDMFPGCEHIETICNIKRCKDQKGGF